MHLQKYLKRDLSTKWSPKLLGPKQLATLQYIGQTPHKYVHIDMKLNFMHILADLGFGGVYPIYWIKESKNAITQRRVNMHAKTFKNQTRYKLDKTPSKPRKHTKV